MQSVKAVTVQYSSHAEQRASEPAITKLIHQSENVHDLLPKSTSGWKLKE